MPDNLFSRIQHLSFFVLLASVSLGFLYLIGDFVLSIIWAAVLAVVFRPLQYYLTRHCGGRSTLAALATMTLAVLLVFLPIAGVGTIVVKESSDLYHNALSTDVSIYGYILQNIPFAENLLGMAGISPNELPIRVAEVIRNAGQNLAGGTIDFGVGVLRFIAKALVMLYLLFFLLRDGARIGAHIMRALPLGDAKEIFLYERFSTVVRAVIKGTLVVALAQGAIGAILFALVGIPSPVLWGMVMALLSLVPGVGPALVWIPAVIILFASGSTGSAIILAVGGLTILSMVDNFLRPLLVGRDTGMPDALILLSVLGGIGAFGVSGIILGPALAALFLASWQLFEEEYRADLTARG